MNKLILDLCAGSGAWSEPYLLAGYQVVRVDLPQDVRLLEIPRYRVHGILAAPPCTYFCTMRQCRGKPTPEQFREGLSVVDACLRIVTMTRPAWWALENPPAYLAHWLGDPVLKFDPWEYGDPWTKRTWVWGQFNKPQLSPVKAAGARVHSGTSHGHGTHTERAVTPPGFAQAFMASNP